MAAMIPDTAPTPEQRAVELETAAEIAEAHQDFVFARELRDSAHAIKCQQPKPPSPGCGLGSG